MNGYLSSEVISLAMLAITLFFYNYKNWIDVKKNRIYLELLHWGLAALFTGTIGNALLLVLPHYTKIINIVSGMFMSVLSVGLCVQFYLYDLAFLKISEKKIKLEMNIVGILAVLSLSFVFISPIVGYETVQKYHLADRFGRGNRLQSAVMLFSIFLGLVHIIWKREKLTMREYVILLMLNFTMAADIIVEVLLNTGNLLSYYVLSVVLVTGYMCLHNMDRYRFMASGCFARGGLYHVLQEREEYRENFYCLGVAIKNIESITNYCTEDEIIEFHRRMGGIMQKNCGKHAVYHNHSFEYMALYSSEDQVKKKHKLLVEKLPDFIRINGKNVALSVDYYAVEFADADFLMENFYNVITSMRKLSAKQENKDTLLRYHGNRQRDIEKNIEAMRVVNHSITNRDFPLRLGMIMDRKNPDKFRMEAIAQGNLENGERISQEELWILSERMGLSKEFGKALMERVCEHIEREGLVTSGITKVHINMTSYQLEDVELAKEYVAVMKKYRVPGRFLCFEVNLNLSSDYKKLEDVFGILRGNGISLLLDQFGASVCSLKTVINMPFDAVKINHRITKAFCAGTSTQLPYLLDMLNGKNWNVIVDGIDEVVWSQQLEGLSFAYAQGYYIDMLYERKKSEHGESGIGESEIGGGVLVG